MSNYSTEELLRILGEEGVEKAPSFSSELEEFITTFHIKASETNKIPSYIIYYTYKQTFGGELSKIEFFRQFKKQFKQRRTGKQRSYAVTGSFDLSREGLIEAEYFEKGLKK